MLNAVQTEPIIIIAARISAFDNRASAIVVKPLASDLYAFDRVGGECREVDINQRARSEIHLQQWLQHLCAPGLCRGKGHGIAHAFFAIYLAHRNRTDSRQRAFHGRRDGTRIGDVITQIGSAINARQNQVRPCVLHNHTQRHHHRIGGRTGHRIMPVAMLANADWAGQRQRMARAGIFLGRGDDPDVVAKLPCDFFQDFQTRCIDAVVIGQQDTHYATGSNRSSPPI